MKLYPRLALEGIKKNKQLYYPYILTCTGMVFMYFIIHSLSASPVVAEIRGGNSSQMLLTAGRLVVAVFAAIFLFYTNSFLSRRRQKEFGLYNILGMSKGNIARLLLCETGITAGIALAAGMAMGLVLYKLSELALVRMLRGDVSFSMNIVWESIPVCILIFAIIFTLLFISNLLRLRLNNPMELLRSENHGEKPPKANWLLGVLGLGILAAAYAIAVSITDPLEAVIWFIVAVIMVIIATYLIFISGSVLLCRVLQKNKAYYYQPRHFVSVASMTYRMKRNGAGLASICILATMVLVMLSSSGSLVIGQEDMLDEAYPHDFMLAVAPDKGMSPELEDEIIALASGDLTVEDSLSYRCKSMYGSLNGEQLRFDLEDGDQPIIFVSVTFIDIETYNRLSGGSESLAAGETILILKGYDYNYDTLDIQHMASLDVKHVLSADGMDKGFLHVPYSSDPYNICVVLDDIGSLQWEGSYYGSEECLRYSFDVAEGIDDQLAWCEDFYPAFSALMDERTDGGYAYSFDCRAFAQAEFYGTYGGLFFLGVLLSIVFLFATVLIIYYKQISEGYEDAGRFEIMQKVGMTRQDIRQSINSQMLTVFLLPIAMAGLHMVFAFPIIRRILYLFSLDNVSLFAGACLLCFGVFAAVYAAVYRLTSNAYYKLVSK